MKKLSIITVTFNAEQTLERTLRSVSSQSYPDIEHIIVDGKSTDSTIDLVHKYENDKLKWISEPDNGLYDAMNKGIKMATGNYLCFLNAGDTFFAEDTVELIMLSNSSADIIYGETAIVDNNGTFLHMRRLKAPEKLTWKSFKQGMLVCHQAFIVRREITEPYDLRYHFSSDFEWSIRMLKKSETIINTNHILINYLNKGMTTTNRKESLKERYRIMVKHYGQLSTFFHHLWFIVRLVIK
ncbi:MAG: glycosyltransferase family 2 protein [Fermentimonas sp.]|nr:glycosyltransferase family 2 protein [Fermentimonas sp.]